MNSDNLVSFVPPINGECVDKSYYFACMVDGEPKYYCDEATGHKSACGACDNPYDVDCSNFSSINLSQTKSCKSCTNQPDPRHKPKPKPKPKPPKPKPPKPKPPKPPSNGPVEDHKGIPGGVWTGLGLSIGLLVLLIVIGLMVKHHKKSSNM